MGKNIVICCDGTNNQFDGEHTNVVRLYKVAERNAGQLTYYDPGVGTMPEPWMSGRLARGISIAKGLAGGKGFYENIDDAYRFLMSSYDAGDNIFLFGFSRGAYTARALAGMIHSVGLLHPGTENLIPYARKYWRKDFGSESSGGRLCKEFKASLSRPCPIHFLGVWDTVSSVGFLNNFLTYPFTQRNPSVSHVRHAVSIDERRSTFRSNLMLKAFEAQDVVNAWFAGVHADIGGGYPAEESGLARICFEWMVEEARKRGLFTSEEKLRQELSNPSPPNPVGLLHHSMRGLWWLVEFLPDRKYSFADHRHHWYFMHVARPRDVLRTATDSTVFVHHSVLERMAALPDYRPSNLPSDPSAVRSKFRVV